MERLLHWKSGRVVNVARKAGKAYGAGTLNDFAIIERNMCIGNGLTNSFGGFMGVTAMAKPTDDKKFLSAPAHDNIGSSATVFEGLGNLF